MSKRLRTFLIWIGLTAAFFVFFTLEQDGDPGRRESFATFLEHIQQDRVRAIRINNNEIYVERADGEPNYTTLGVVDDEVTQQVSDHGGLVTWGEPPNHLRTMLIVVLPLLLIVAFLWYFAKKANSNHNSIFSLGKSRARQVTDGRTVKFQDVAGCEEAKEMLGDVVDFLRSPKRWSSAGARLPRGVLLEGPPGCGKTLLARAVSGETEAAFYSVSASEFVELVVGVGAARVRDMFDTARKNAPAVVFIDELDAVGRRRGSGIGFGHDEREQTLNQLLVSLDGFEISEQVVVIAATNRSDVLDPALLRPGRFDRRIEVPQLSLAARQRAWEIHASEKPLGEDVSLAEMAERSAGYTGAEIESAANEAALLAVRRARHDGHGSAIVRQDDLVQGLQSLRTGDLEMDAMDAMLVDSARNLARPESKAIAQVSLRSGGEVIGEVLWADAEFIKIKDLDEEQVIVAKRQIQSVRALAETESFGVSQSLPVGEVASLLGAAAEPVG